MIWFLCHGDEIKEYTKENITDGVREIRKSSRSEESDAQMAKIV
jgi:hypothetical protein